jgi:anti-sigma B factor antagonist
VELILTGPEGLGRTGTPSLAPSVRVLSTASIAHYWENNDVLVVGLSGEIDMSNVDDLRDEIGLVARAGTRCVVFDLSSLDFIDSSGLSLLVTVANDVGAARLRGPSLIVRRLVDLTGLGQILPTEENVPTDET